MLKPLEQYISYITENYLNDIMVHYYYYLSPGTYTFPFKSPCTEFYLFFLKNLGKSKPTIRSLFLACHHPSGQSLDPRPCACCRWGHGVCARGFLRTHPHLSTHLPGPAASPVTQKAMGRGKEAWVPGAQLPATVPTAYVGLRHLQ